MYDGGFTRKMAKSIRFKLYEEFYNRNFITKDIALKIVGESDCSQYIKNPQKFKSLANEISLKYHEFINKNTKKNISEKDFITEEILVDLIENTVMDIV